MVSISPTPKNIQTEPARGPRAQRPGFRRWIVVGTALGSAVLLAGALVGQVPAYAAEAPVGLGTVGSYSVLGGTTVTNTGPTTLAGDLGVNPGSAVTGFPPGLVSGATHAGDAVAGQAQSDLTIAYDDAAGRATTASVAGDLVGQTLAPGVYTSSGPLSVSGALTLDGQGDPGSVFIFQVASTLTTATASSIVLTNNAQACNVYWQVGSSATLGTASTFVGSILALTSITATTGTRVEGRALARNGQVALDTNVFTLPGCATATPSPTGTASATPLPTTAAPSATTTPTATPAPTSASPSPTPIPTNTGTGAGAGTGTGTGTGNDAGNGPGTGSGSDLAGTGAGSGADTGADSGAGTGAGRGVNIDTAAETHVSNTGILLAGAVLVSVLAGVLVLGSGRRLFRRIK